MRRVQAGKPGGGGSPHTFGMHKQQSHTLPHIIWLEDIFPYFTQQKQSQTQLLPQLALTFSFCPVSSVPKHSSLFLTTTTDRNFKFNSPFSRGRQVTTHPIRKQPPVRPLNAILWLSLLLSAAFVASFLLAFYYVYGKCGIPEDILLCNFLTSR